jgi:hypothetical protein
MSPLPPPLWRSPWRATASAGLAPAPRPWTGRIAAEEARIATAMAEIAARTLALRDAQSVEDLTALLTSAGER